MNSIYLILIIIGMTAVCVGISYLLVQIGAQWEVICGHKRVEARFLEIWDRTAEGRLLAWLKVHHNLVAEQAPTVELEACKKRIAVIKAQHWQRHQVRLKSGRVVVISTLN